MLGSPTAVIAAAIIFFAAAALLLASSAEAHRRATRAESRQMWKAVEAKYGSTGCIERRGEISTAPTRKKYGTVIISDRHCGNGQFVLSKRRHADHARWRSLGAGSDWGAPERCEQDLYRIPRAVLEDFFGLEVCAGFSRVGLGSTAASGGSPPGALESSQPALRLSPEGLGPMRFGMDSSQASKALEASVDVEPGINGCSFWTMPGLEQGAQVIALQGRLAYVLLYQRGQRTTRGIEVGDGFDRLRHRYRGNLHHGRSASLSGANLRLFVTEHSGGASYELEFDIVNGRVAFISAGTKRTIETFGECA